MLNLSPYPGEKITSSGILLLFVFALSAQPKITSFTPLYGPAGSAVTISGSGFNTTPSQNIVFFGAVRASVTNATASTLTVTVPVGATYQPISVTTGNLTAYSNLPFVLSFPASGPLSTASFTPYINTPIGNGPDQALIADLDGDGKPDLIQNNQRYPYEDSLSIFRNSSVVGTISFSPALKFALASTKTTIAIADLNGDGKVDIVVTNYYPSTITVFTNTSVSGTISFDGGTTLTTGPTPTFAAIADIDNDGKPDIIVADYGSNMISVLRNTSSGTALSFAAKQDFPAPSYTQGIALTDLDGDGKIDVLVMGSFSDSVLAYRNISTVGSINLTTGPSFRFTGELVKIVTGDLDGDGKPDLVVLNDSSTSFFVLRNTSSAGSISFGPQISVEAVGAGDIGLADLNGDGIPDVALSDGANNTIVVFPNTSTIGTLSFSSGVVYPVGYVPLYLAFGDLDGDGRTDMMSSNYFTQSICLLRNISNDSLAPQINSFAPDSAATGDTVTITGKYFTGTITVNLGTVPAATFAVISDSVLRVTVGMGQTGKIQVATANGNDTSALSFTYIPPPSISSVSPDSASTGTTVLIHGANFSGAVSVSFGGTAASAFTLVSDSLISATVGQGTSGYVSVQTRGGKDSIGGFVFIPVQQTHAPIVQAFGPDSAATGNIVNITGHYFTGTTAVRFGGTAAASYTVVSDSLITAVVGPGASGYVSVFTPNGADSLIGFYYIAASLPPVIRTFTPDSGTAGTTIVISGSHFTGAGSVTIGGVPAASFNVISDSVIDATIGAGASGFVKVASSTGADSLAGFVFLSDTAMQQPQITSFSPASGSVGATVTVIGQHFTGTTSVTIGGIPASSFIVVSDSVIQAIVGPGAVSGNVTVTTPGGTASLNLFVVTTGLVIFPNPASGTVTIDFPLSSAQALVRLTDFSGRVITSVVIEPGVTTKLLNLEGLQLGVYVISWRDGSTTLRKIILVK